MLQVVRLRIASMMADVPGVGMTRVRRRLALTSRVRYSASVRRARLKRRLQYRGMTGQRQGPPGVTGGAGGLLSSAIVTVAQNHERGYIWRRDPRFHPDLLSLQRYEGSQLITLLHRLTLAEHVYADQNGRHGADHPTNTIATRQPEQQREDRGTGQRTDLAE
jgi:hypothetical protein